MLRSHSRNFLKKLLLSFGLFLAVSLSSSVIIYSVSEAALREEVVAHTNASLEQLKSTLDGQLSEALSIMRAFELDSTYAEVLRSYRQEGTLSGYARRQVWQLLKTDLREAIGDLFFYFPKADLVVSQYSGSCSLELYMQMMFEHDPRTHEDWKALLSRYHSETITSVVCRHENGRANLLSTIPNGNNLLLLISLPTNRAQGTDVTVGCIINDQLLKVHSDQTVLLLSETEGVMAQSRAFPLPDDPTLLLKPTYEMGGVTYISNHLPSRYDFQYISLLENDFFWESLNELRGVMILCVAAYLLIACVMVSILTRRSYRPVSNLVNAVARQTGQAWDKTAGSELEYIGNAFSLHVSDMQNMRGQLKSLLKRRFLMECLSGMKRSEPYAESFERHDIPLLSERFCVGIVRLETGVPIDLPDQLELLSTPAWHIEALQLGPYMTVLLVNLSPDAQDIAAELAQALQKHINQLYSQLCTVAISQEGEGYTAIQHCYEQAHSLLNYRLIDGEGTLVLPSRLRPEKALSTSRMQQCETLLRAAFLAGQHQQNPDELYHILFACCFGESEVSLSSARMFISVVSSLLINMVQDAIPLHFAEIEDHAQRLLCADTLPTFRRAFGILYGIAVGRLAAEQQQPTIADEIQAYLSENYADPTLCVNTLGDRFHMSPSYLSLQFKRQCGQSIIECLTTTRLKHATELLLCTDTPIDEIGEAVGIPSSTSFNRAFKKAYGITPGAYRKTFARR